MASCQLVPLPRTEGSLKRSSLKTIPCDDMSL